MSGPTAESVAFSLGLVFAYIASHAGPIVAPVALIWSVLWFIGWARLVWRGSR